MSGNINFDPIVIGESNALAWDLAQEVMLHPCGKYSLVYLHGVSGVGKTQMLRAIEHGLRANHPDLNILFTTADQMTDLLIQDIVEKSRSTFRERHQNTDVLLVDDIQHLAGKEATQEEFVKLFDAFCARGKQIVIASDRPACEFVRLNEHLQRRLESTASAEIREPGLEVRRTIVERECCRMGLVLSEDVSGYLAEQAHNPFRILGLVRRVALCHEMQRMPLDMDHVKACLEELLEPRPVGADRVLELVCRYYNLEALALLGASKTKGIGHARRVLAYLLSRHGKVSLPEIGRMMNRDHTTILHDIRWVEAEQKKGGTIAETIHDLQAMLSEERSGV